MCITDNNRVVRLGTFIRKVTYVSRRIRNSFEVSQDAFEWFIRKRLETFRMNFECVLRRFRMISQSVSRCFGIYSKRLKTLLNESFKSVLRRFRINTKASWDTSNKYQSVLSIERYRTISCDKSCDIERYRTISHDIVRLIVRYRTISHDTAKTWPISCDILIYQSFSTHMTPIRLREGQLCFRKLPVAMGNTPTKFLLH